MSIEIDNVLPGLDLNVNLIKNPASTFFGRVSGTSMINAGIDDGDLLIIDKALDYKTNALAVCCINGDFTLKRIEIKQGQVFLMPANDHFNPILVKEDDVFTIWGIVTYIIKKP